MNNDWMRGVVVGGLLALVGCVSSPPGRSSGGGSDGGDVLDVGVLARDLWGIEENSLEPSGERTALRVAILEVRVEYVDEGKTSSGAGVPVDFSTSLMLELPTVLHNALAEILPEYDDFVVPTEELRSLKSYARLVSEDGTVADKVIGARTAGASAGKEPVVVPASGQAVLDWSRSEVRDAAKELLAEAEADIGFRALIRVGVHDGRASIEKGSRLVVVAPRGVYGLSTKLKLVSALQVLGESDEADGALATVLPIDTHLYVRAIERLFRAGFDLAVVAHRTRKS